MADADDGYQIETAQEGLDVKFIDRDDAEPIRRGRIRKYFVISSNASTRRQQYITARDSEVLLPMPITHPKRRPCRVSLEAHK